jgi:porin
MRSAIFPLVGGVCRSTITLVLAAVSFSVGGSFAADLSVKDLPPPEYYISADDLWTGQYLLGDLGRARLKREGIEFTGEITNESVANTSGGDKTGGANAGQFTFGATVRTDTLAGLHGGLFGIKLVDRWGRNLNDDMGIPALQLTNEVFGRGNILRLVEFHYEQKLLNDTLEVKGGRLPVGSDFFFQKCDFLNLTLCGGQPGNLYGGYIYNFPISQMAGVVKVNLPGGFQFATGIYDSNTNYLETKPGVALLPIFAPSEPNAGVLAPVELKWTGGIHGLQGIWKIGGWYSDQNAQQAVAAFGAAGATPVFQRGEYGGYVSIYQQLRGPGGFKDAPDPKQGLFTFFNVTIGDHRTSVLDYQAVWGLQQVGTFASRPDDKIGFGVGTTHINSSIAAAEATAHWEVQHNEYPLEAWYDWQATPWLSLRFDMQYVINPGGYDDGNNLADAHGNAFIIGLRTFVKL